VRGELEERHQGAVSDRLFISRSVEAVAVAGIDGLDCGLDFVLAEGCAGGGGGVGDGEAVGGLADGVEGGG